MSYVKQNWIDNVSIANAERMNHIEEGIYNKADYLTYSREIILNGYFDEHPTEASSNTYTFDDSGFLYVFATRGSTGGYTLKINFDGVDRFNFPAYDPYAVVELMIPVTSGQTLKLSTDSNTPTWTIRELRFMK